MKIKMESATTILDRLLKDKFNSTLERDKITNKIIILDGYSTHKLYESAYNHWLIAQGYARPDVLTKDLKCEDEISFTKAELIFMRSDIDFGIHNNPVRLDKIVDRIRITEKLDRMIKSKS